MANSYYTFSPVFVAGTKARSGAVNQQLQAIETAFDSLPSSTSAIKLGKATLGTESGSGNAFVVTLADVRTANAEGDEIVFKATHANTGASTLQVSSITAAALRRFNGDPLVAGDIQVGLYYVARYDAANSRFLIIAPAQVSTVSGAITYATPTAEVGLTAVAGAATSVQRSDASPALSQAIVPTWTGQHTFTQATLFADGNAAAPSFAPASDLNTGLYSAGADSLGVAAGGANVATFAAAAITFAVALTGAAISGTTVSGTTVSGTTVSGTTVLAAAGAAATPSVSFSSDSDSGLFSSAADVVGIAAAGSSVATFSASAVTAAVPVLNSAGSAAAPSLSFSGDTNSGLYSVGADNIGFATAGALRLAISTTVAQFQNAVQIQTSDGSAAAPSYAFSGDTNTGVYLSGADAVAFSVGGNQVARFETTFARIIQPVLGNDGTAPAPMYSFVNDTNSGMYSISGDVIGFSTGGGLRFAVTNTVAQCQNGVQFQVYDGSAAAPSYAFSGDTDTGMYRLGTNRIGFASAGVVTLAIDSNLTFGSNVAIRGQDGTSSNPFYSFDNDTNTGIYRSATDRLSITAGGTTRANFDASFASVDTPLFRVTGIHNGTSPTGATDQYIASGTYTPTLTAGANIQALTSGVCQWLRVGNVVYVSGAIEVDPVSAIGTSFGLSLPLASNLTSIQQLAGYFLLVGGDAIGSFTADVANDRASGVFTAIGTASNNVYFQLSYLMN